MSAAVINSASTWVTPKESAEFRLGHRPGLDGLRAVAILFVLVVHLDRLQVLPFSLASGGFLGVDLFFVISGFLITSILIEEHGNTGTISLSRFYARRALRLLPALFSVLIVVGLAGAVFNSSFGLTPIRVASTVGYFSNWIRAFESWEQVWILAHFWSLSIEEQFYLIWPVALVLMLRSGLSENAVLRVALLGTAAACVLRLVLFLNGAPSERLYHGSDTRADALLIGCALSLAAHSGVRFTRVIESLYPASLIVFLSAALFISQRSAMLYLGGFTVIALCSAVVLFRTVENPQKIFVQPFMQWIGKRSYGLYLWHWPIYEASRLLPEPFVLPCAVLATFAVAAISFKYLETPFLKKKALFKSRSVQSEY